MKKTCIVLTLVGPLLFMALEAPAQENYPRTFSGKPDFNGHYDISTLTPFERPTSFGDRLFLNEEEVKSMRDREMGIRSRDAESSDANRAAPEQGGNIGSYNDFGSIEVTTDLL